MIGSKNTRRLSRTVHQNYLSRQPACVAADTPARVRSHVRQAKCGSSMGKGMDGQENASVAAVGTQKGLGNDARWGCSCMKRDQGPASRHQARLDPADSPWFKDPGLVDAQLGIPWRILDSEDISHLYSRVMTSCLIAKLTENTSCRLPSTLVEHSCHTAIRQEFVIVRAPDHVSGSGSTDANLSSLSLHSRRSELVLLLCGYFVVIDVAKTWQRIGIAGMN